uniref:Uncharacterized protein n=1 Tax=Oryza meridionalis TaxID=40149 RepID=A0A0E0CIF3_9ORYZ
MRRGFRKAKRRTGRGHEGGGAAALQCHPAGDMAVEKTSDELMAGPHIREGAWEDRRFGNMFF